MFNVILLIAISLNGISLYKMSRYFPKCYEPFGGDINVKLIFQFMPQKQTLKVFHDTLSFALKKFS